MRKRKATGRNSDSETYESDKWHWFTSLTRWWFQFLFSIFTLKIGKKIQFGKYSDGLLNHQPAKLFPQTTLLNIPSSQASAPVYQNGLGLDQQLEAVEVKLRELEEERSNCALTIDMGENPPKIRKEGWTVAPTTSHFSYVLSHRPYGTGFTGIVKSTATKILGEISGAWFSTGKFNHQASRLSQFLLGFLLGDSSGGGSRKLLDLWCIYRKDKK